MTTTTKTATQPSWMGKSISQFTAEELADFQRPQFTPERAEKIAEIGRLLRPSYGSDPDLDVIDLRCARNATA